MGPQKRRTTMGDEKAEQPLIEIRGSEGLNFKGYKKPGEEGEENKESSAGTGEGENIQKEVLTLEEAEKKYPHLKIKISVAGEEKVLGTGELAKHYQLYSGRERTIEQRNQESARLQEELRQLRADLTTIRDESANRKIEKDEDPDDPVVFVTKASEKVIESRVEPKIAALDKKLDAVLSLIEPAIEDGRSKKAKEMLMARGIDVSSFDEFRQKRLKQEEEDLGRPLTAKEITRISADRWAIEYALALAAGKVTLKKEKPVEGEEEADNKRSTHLETQGTLRSSGGGGYRPNRISKDRSFAEANKSGKWAEHLRRKGVRPFGSQPE